MIPSGINGLERVKQHIVVFLIPVSNTDDPVSLLPEGSYYSWRLLHRPSKIFRCSPLRWIGVHSNIFFLRYSPILYIFVHTILISLFLQYQLRKNPCPIVLWLLCSLHSLAVLFHNNGVKIPFPCFLIFVLFVQLSPKLLLH